MALRTDYKDDILDLTQNTQRKYRMITNTDGTVSFEDVTIYSQVGDSFGASQLNEIANAVTSTKGNIDYDISTDWVQLKDKDGNWHNWEKGGLTSTYLVKNGQINTDLCGDLIGGTGGWSTNTKGVEPTINLNDSNVTIISNGTTIDSTGTASFENMIDLTDVSSISIDYSANVNLASGFTRGYPVIMYVGADKDSIVQNTAVAFVIILNKSIQSANGKISLDVSALSGSYYIGFALHDQNYDGSAYPDTTTTLIIDNMQIE